MRMIRDSLVYAGLAGYFIGLAVAFTSQQVHDSARSLWPVIITFTVFAVIYIGVTRWSWKRGQHDHAMSIYRFMTNVPPQARQEPSRKP